MILCFSDTTTHRGKLGVDRSTGDPSPGHARSAFGLVMTGAGPKVQRWRGPVSRLVLLVPAIIRRDVPPEEGRDQRDFRRAAGGAIQRAACSVGFLLGEGGFGGFGGAERLVVNDGDGEIDAL